MSRRRTITQDLDWATILLYLALVFIGWITIYASAHDENSGNIFNAAFNYGKQFQWMIISFVVAIAILIIDSKFYTSFSYVIYGLMIALLIVVLFVGTEIKGARSWLVIGGFRIQPSELAKFATSLAVAKYLSTLNIDLRQLRDKLIAFVLIGLPMVLIIIQGDLGSALVFGIFVLVFFREGLEPGFLIIGVTVILLTILALLINKFILLVLFFLIGTAIIYRFRKRMQIILMTIGFILFSTGYVFSIDYAINNILEPHQRDRINVLVGKEGNDWNIRQSKIAIGSGGFLGKGFLKGTQTKFDFVPEQSTDFIFCTIGEEFGFAGSFLLLSLFLALLLRLVYISERQRSRFTRIYGYCVACILFFHFLINIGMTISLVPVIGIPLPFISYGGSSLLSFTILLFILLRLDAERLMVLR